MCSSRVRALTAAFIMMGFFLSACAGFVPAGDPDAQQKPYFRPPLPEATITAQSGPDSAVQVGSGAPGQPDAECENNLTFLKDVTISDGTPVTARSTLDKRWEVENSGSCGWTENFRMRLIAGPAMGAQPEQALYPARSGSHAILRITFQAPNEPGSYRSAWQAHSPEGEPFGDPFFIDILVEEAAP